MPRTDPQPFSPLRAALSALYAVHGHLTASLVVDAASDPASPLHTCFSWDDAEAAGAYRLMQARTLIRTIRVIRVDNASHTLIHVPAQTIAGRVREGTYQIDRIVANNPSAYERAMAEALADLDAASRRVQELRRLRPQARQRFAVALESLATAKLALVGGRSA